MGRFIISPLSRRDSIALDIQTNENSLEDIIKRVAQAQEWWDPEDGDNLDDCVSVCYLMDNEEILKFTDVTIQSAKNLTTAGINE